MTKPFLKSLIVVSMMTLLGACVAEKKLTLTATDKGTFSFPSPRSYWNGRNIDLVGKLEFPEKVQGKVPAMVIMHGSAGQGSRDYTWAKYFREQGVASFMVDYYSTRGMSRGGAGGPKNPYDLTGAVKFLSTHPKIDASKIGTIGFSRGGSIVMSTLRMSEREFGGKKPVLNVNLYGSCVGNTIDRETTDAPILIIIGDQDDLQPVALCTGMGEDGKRAGKDIRVHVMPGGTHAFDDDKSGTVPFGGKTVRISSSSRLAAQAREIVGAAMAEAFK